MTSAIIANAKKKMQKSIEALQQDLGRLRTGRANPNLLDHVMVNSYGSDTPLNRVASVSVEGARSLIVTPWDKGLTTAIEKAIIAADLGLNPVSAGSVIRVPLPALTEERRRDLIKIVKEEGEKAKVSVRNARRDANNLIKDQQKEKIINEDEMRRAEGEVQKVTDGFISDIDKLLQVKEKELMEI